MTGRSNEPSEIIRNRQINVCCVQETKWRGFKSRNIGNDYQLLYHGTTNKRNGVGIILDKNLKQRIINVERKSDRLIAVKLAMDNHTPFNIISPYAPQTGCTEQEKLDFWDDFDQSASLMWSDFEKFCIEKAREILGVSKGALRSAKDPSWWNDNVKELIKSKRNAFKTWQKSDLDEDRAVYRVLEGTVKSAVAQSRAAANEDFYNRLKKAENENTIYKTAHQRHRLTLDIKNNKYIRNTQGKLLKVDKDITERWKEYYEQLMNEEFLSEPIPQLPPIERPLDAIILEETRKAIAKMKYHKAVSSDQIPASPSGKN
ncbi:uncharacterized protein LOC131844568 [Achroia grisella]|uniref:uncharacterized protein LOC131844568 n=1 Tax=Achroia grisella TaxID=688607 RepID=UPI0027D2E27C|nr:uncharacterized protein LOC131844568 [Achroia grisella]